MIRRPEGLRVRHIGLQRDETTAIATTYYSKLPSDLGDSYVLLIDPMFATDGGAVAAIDLLKACGARMVCTSPLLRCALIERNHPDVVVYTPVVDRQLNARKHTSPGLGDFGDRLRGTI